jgi:pSer/pThr/pTyr-binding forkhead associated (FHA) protein
LSYSLIIEDPQGIIVEQVSFDETCPLTIGRSDAADVQLKSNSVSRQHARVFIQDDQCFVADLNSSNGVYVDGQRIYGTTQISQGTQIRIGDFLMLVQQSIRPDQPHPDQTNLDDTNEALQFPRLIRIGDALEGETYSLSADEHIIGRTDDNFIVLQDGSISRNHAKLTIQMGNYILQDLGSSNGTMINKTPIHQPTYLNGAELIQLGNINFVFATPGQSIDINQYTKMLESSNTGLLAAVTVIGIILLLLTGSIGYFVVTRESPEPVVVLDLAEQNAVRVNQLITEGNGLLIAESWNEAITKFTTALHFDPNNLEARNRLIQAQMEYETYQQWSEINAEVTRAGELVQQGNQSDALEVFETVRNRLERMPPESVYASRSQERRNTEIDPALFELYTAVGQSRLSNSQFPEASARFSRAMSIIRSQSELPESPIDNAVKQNLWQMLIVGANASSSASQFASAVQLFDFANQISELPQENLNQLGIALVNAGNGAYRAENYRQAIQYYRRADPLDAMTREARRYRDSAYTHAVVE